MDNIIFSFIEEKLRRLYHRGFMKKKKEEFILLKIQTKILLKMLFRVIFYFLLILGGFSITAIIGKTPYRTWLLITLFVLIITVCYESVDYILEKDIERLQKKAHTKHGPDFGIKK